MRPITRSLATTATVLVVVASGFGAPVATADLGRSGSDSPPSASPAADLGPTAIESHLVTLLSGDVIRVDELADGTSRGVVTEDVGPQGIAISSVDDQVMAVPYEAAPLVVDGTLDAALFDVSRLVADGYADDSSATLPVIVSYAGDRRASAGLPDGARTTARFTHLNAAAARVAKATTRVFWSDLTDSTNGIDRIWLDAKVSVALDESVPYIGAPQAWADGFDGTGVRVAVLDSGIDPSHPDLAGKVVESRNFTYNPDAIDHNGHGTHVASTIAGSGAASGGDRKGVAPGVELLNGKVLADWGSGLTSWIMSGMEWAVAQDADIVSMSLGACCGDGTDVLSQLVNQLSAQSDTLFVIAAGNDGAMGRGTIGAPGTASAALTVGATGHTDDIVAEFSSRGPDRGFHLKPDITAPGVGIVAARADGTAAGTPVDDDYTALSGTSMATPHVAGAAAIVRQQHPDWTAQQVKDALVSTGARGPDDVYEQGGGRVDVERAVRQPVHATGALDFGPYEAPFADGQPATDQITYTNSSDQPVTLDLAVEAHRIGGDAEPVSAATVSPSQVTVPAGGTATATVTIDLAAGDLATYGGWVTATDADAGIEAHTSIGWAKRPEDAKLTVSVQDRLGGPTPTGLVWLFNLAAGTTHIGNIVNGQVHYADLGLNPEIPVGDYMLLASFPTRVEDGRPVHYVEAVLPELQVTEDTEYVLDAAQTEQLRFETPRPTQELGSYRLTAEREYGDHVFRAGSPLGDIALLTNQAPYVTPTEPVTEGDFALTMYGRLVGPPLTIAPATGPDRRTLEPYYLWCIGNEACYPEFDGDKRLDIVDAGDGSAELLTPERVRGKVAIINPDPAVSTEDLAQRAEAAGAAGVVFWEDDGPVASSVRAISVRLPLMWVGTDDGEWLVDRTDRHPRFRFRGERPVPYAYDVAVTEEGQVPDDLTYTPDTSRLATVHRELRHRGTEPACTHWDDLPPWLSGSCRPTPHVWTHYALPGLQYISASGSSWGADVYRPRERVNEVFDAGPLAPGAVESDLYPVPSSTRANGAAGDTITFTPGEPLREADPARYNQRFWPLIDERIAVFRDGERIGDEAARQLTLDVPGESAGFRMVYDATSVVPGALRTTRSHTEWTFTSRHGTKATTTLPQLQVDYGVPLDVYNRARAGSYLPIRIAVGQPEGSATSSSMSKITLDVSFDGGQSWREVGLHGWGDWRLGLLKHPRFEQTDGYVALRVYGRDKAGNTVDQTLYQAYALRP